MAVKCPHYQPLPGTTRCVSYLSGPVPQHPDLDQDGGCSRSDVFMCVLWLERFSEPGWEDQAGRVWPVDEDGVVHLTRRTSPKDK